MPDAQAARPPLLRALRDTAVTTLLAFGLFLPLIGFNTFQNIRNELVLETRWRLLAAIVVLLAGLRLRHACVVAPLIAQRTPHPARSLPAPLPAALQSALLAAAPPSRLASAPIARPPA